MERKQRQEYFYAEVSRVLKNFTEARIVLLRHIFNQVNIKSSLPRNYSRIKKYYKKNYSCNITNFSPCSFNMDFITDTMCKSKCSGPLSEAISRASSFSVTLAISSKSRRKRTGVVASVSLWKESTLVLVFLGFSKSYFHLKCLWQNVCFKTTRWQHYNNLIIVWVSFAMLLGQNHGREGKTYLWLQQ